MNTIVLYFVSLFIHVLPETQCFRLKRILYRLAGIKIGKNVHICSSVCFLGSGKIEIGDNTWIGHHVLIISSSKVKIGCNVDIAPKVYIGTGSHIIDSEGEHSAGKGINEDVIIEDGVWLCVGVTILSGVTIGKKSVIASGSVVTKKVVSYFLYGGIPAKKIKEI